MNLEKQFALLCGIVRAQHFAWREAVRDLCPGVDVAEVTKYMWEVTGKETARAYLKRLDPEQPLAPQVAASVVLSSQCMGEDAVLEVTDGKDEAFVRHRDCPWFAWHEQRGLLEEDRAGCDRWFFATVEEINRELGTNLQVETLASLPDGDGHCLRRFWNE